MKGRPIKLVDAAPAASAVTAARRRVWQRMGFVGVWIIGPQLDYRLIYGNHVLTPHRYGLTGAPKAGPQKRQAAQWGLGFRPQIKRIAWVDGERPAKSVSGLMDVIAEDWLRETEAWRMPLDGWVNAPFETVSGWLDEAARESSVKLYTETDCDAWFGQYMEAELDKLRGRKRA